MLLTFICLHVPHALRFKNTLICETSRKVQEASQIFIFNFHAGLLSLVEFKLYLFGVWRPSCMTGCWAGWSGPDVCSHVWPAGGALWEVLWEWHVWQRLLLYLRLHQCHRLLPYRRHLLLQRRWASLGLWLPVGLDYSASAFECVTHRGSCRCSETAMSTLLCLMYSICENLHQATGWLGTCGLMHLLTTFMLWYIFILTYFSIF